MPVHSTAVVHPEAVIDSSTQIGPHAVIDGPVRIGPDCRIGPSAVILGHTEIGAGCSIHAHAVVGDIPQDHAWDGSESFCRIGESCVLREGATVHRATGEGQATVVGSRCYLMTGSHVAHNCVLGSDVILVSGALLGGHVEVGDRAIISGNAAVHQFVRIGRLAMVGGLAKVVQDVPPFLMTDRNGRIAGLNSVGLLRAGLAAEDRKELRELFRRFYRSGVFRRHAIEQAGGNVTTDAGRQFLEFLAAESRRGTNRGSSRKRSGE